MWLKGFGAARPQHAHVDAATVGGAGAGTALITPALARRQARQAAPAPGAQLLGLVVWVLRPALVQLPQDMPEQRKKHYRAADQRALAGDFVMDEPDP